MKKYQKLKCRKSLQKQNAALKRKIETMQKGVQYYKAVTEQQEE